MKKASCLEDIAINTATAAIAATAVAAAMAVFCATAAAAATAVAAAIKCELHERRWPEKFESGSIKAQAILIIMRSIFPLIIMWTILRGW